MNNPECTAIIKRTLMITYYMNILSQTHFKRLENFQFIDNKEFIIYEKLGYQEYSRYQ